MITAVAIRWGSYTLALNRPARHDAVIMMAYKRAQLDADFAKAYRARRSGDAQGFVDHHGRFLTRAEARAHAVDCGQVRADALRYDDTIFSEDIW